MLRGLQLSRFKSYEEARLPLGPFTLLIGAHASGKSNLRDALRFLRGCAQGYDLTEVCAGRWDEGGVQLWKGIRGGIQEISWRGAESFQLEAGLETAGHPPFRYTLQVALDRARGTAQVAGESLYSGDSRLFDSHPAEDPVSQKGQGALRVRFGGGDELPPGGPPRQYSTALSILAQVAEDLRVDPAYRAPAAAALQSLRSLRFLSLDPEVLRETSQPGARQLGERGEDLAAALHEVYRDREARALLCAWFRGLPAPGVASLEFPEDGRGRTGLLLVDARGDRTSADSACGGLLQLLAFAAAALGRKAGSIYFCERLEGGIHPTFLPVLLDLLERVASLPAYATQFIATSHSPQLASLLSSRSQGDAVLAYRLPASGASNTMRIVDLPGLRAILARQDLGQLFASGLLEEAVELA